MKRLPEYVRAVLSSETSHKGVIAVALVVEVESRYFDMAPGAASILEERY
jgi:hypothetical protein